MFAIAAANAITLPAILALLPAANDHRASHWAAMADGQLAGAGSLLWLGSHDPPGFTTQLFVRPAWRRQGIGRALVAAMAKAAAGETAGLWSANCHDDASEAAAFLRRLGFAPAEQQLRFRMPAAGVLEQLDPLLARLQARGRIPADVQTPGLRDAPLAQVALLVAEAFGQQPATVRRRLATALVDPVAVNLDPDISTVVISQGRVIGVVLASITAGIATVDCNIVAPDHRGSWVNALQLHVATSRAQPLAAQIDFSCDARARDSVNMATRAGGTLLAATSRYWRAL